MYKLLYALIEDYAGMDEAAYDWEVWGKYSNLYEALFVMMESVREDIIQKNNYAYRIVKGEE